MSTPETTTEHHQTPPDTMKIPEYQTTERIKNTLGASYTISEVKGMLAQMRATSAKQAPLFDGRLLDRIARLESALGTA